MTVPWPWPEPEDDGAARHLAGALLPEIVLDATNGRPVDLARWKGRAIVFVYPWTGRPGLPNPPGWDEIPGAHGSTPEAEGFRESYAAFQAKGIDILGLSGQTASEQQEFAARCRLPFPLLSDHDGKLRAALRLPVFETAGVVYLKRLTLVIRAGAIERIVYPVHPPHTHARDLLSTFLV